MRYGRDALISRILKWTNILINKATSDCQDEVAFTKILRIKHDYKIEINIKTLGKSVSDLTYYILKNDIPIDQCVAIGGMCGSQYYESCKSAIEYLLDMYY